MKNIKTPHEHVNYTKYQFENTKIAPKTKLIFFLSFLMLKTCFHYTWIMEKS